VSRAPLWIFGYGSLIWRAGFPFERREAAHVRGWTRRLDQGSPDHRGTPERLGRVATLVRAPGARCGGAAYLVADHLADEVLAALDHRERGGYERISVAAWLDGGEVVSATTWIASADNPYHLGAAPLADMVAQICAAVGPSGSNVEYVVELARALEALRVDDPHIRAVSDALRGA